MEFHFGDMNIERMVARTSAQTSIEGALPLRGEGSAIPKLCAAPPRQALPRPPPQRA